MTHLNTQVRMPGNPNYTIKTINNLKVRLEISYINVIACQSLFSLRINRVTEFADI